MTPEQMATFQPRSTGSPDGEEWDARRRPRHRPATSSAASSTRVPFARRGPSAAEPRRVAGARPTLAVGRRAARAVDPGGVRPDHGRAGARDLRARRADRHHLARRDGLDQPRRLGQPPRRLRPHGARGRLPRRAGRLADAVAQSRRPASTSSSASPRTTCSSLLAALGLAARAVRRAAAAGRHALRPVHRPRPRCAELRLLPGRPLPARRDAVGHHAGARRAAPTSRSARR